MADRARGALLGLAVGDALGAAVEWLHPDQIHARYGGPLRDLVASPPWDRGEWTDDTAMAMELATSLAEKGVYDEEDVFSRYAMWARSSPKDIGSTVSKDGSYGEVESVKAVSDLISPLSGEVLEVNQQVVDAPETVNDDPYGNGWLIRIRMSNPDERDQLLDVAGYRDVLNEA